MRRSGNKKIDPHGRVRFVRKAGEPITVPPPDKCPPMYSKLSKKQQIRAGVVEELNRKNASTPSQVWEDLCNHLAMQNPDYSNEEILQEASEITEGLI